MAEGQVQPGQGQSADSVAGAAPAPQPTAGPAAGAPDAAAEPVPGLAPASPTASKDDPPGWYPRSSFRNLTGYEPDPDGSDEDSDVSRWYTASEGGLSTRAINPPGLAVQIGYADFWARFAAQALDVAVIYVLTYACLLSGLGVVAIPVVVLGYFPFFWIRYGATPGMRVCGLRILRSVDGEAVDFSVAAMRFLIFFLEIVTVVGLAGFAVAAFEGRKRAVHDLVAGTIVVQAQITTD